MARILLGRVRSCEEDSASSLLPSVLGTDGLKLKRFKASGVLRVSLGTGRARLRHWGVGVDGMVEPPSLLHLEVRQGKREPLVPSC